MSTTTVSQHIIDEVGSWPGVTIDDGELGELSFQVDGREIGHLHGEAAAHFSFPRRTWAELHDAGRITHHPVFPDATQGPAARAIRSEDDVTDVIELFRLNYERVMARSRPTGPTVA